MGSVWYAIKLCINYPLTPIKTFSLPAKCFRLARFLWGGRTFRWYQINLISILTIAHIGLLERPTVVFVQR